MTFPFPTTLYRIDSKGKPRLWEVDVDEAEVSTTWGIVDGKLQTTTRECTDCGVAGHADYLTPEQNAINIAERLMIKKREQGWRGSLPKESQDLHTYEHITSFPKEMCFYKPQNSPNEDKINQLLADRNAVVTEKRDGMMHILYKDGNSSVRIFTRRMDDSTARFPHIQDWAELHLPNHTLLLGEMVLAVQEKDGSWTDSFESGISRICRSDPEKAVTIQEESGKAELVVFDVIYWNNECLLDSCNIAERLAPLQETYWDAFELSEAVEELLDIDPYEAEPEPVYPVGMMNVRLIDLTTDKTTMVDTKLLKLLAVQNKLEGYVVWDKTQLLSLQNAVRFDGKPKRPKFCWKVKPKYEDDFRVKFDPDNGEGAFYKDTDRTMLGKVALYRVDKEDNETYVCDCGGGLSKDQRAQFVSLDYPRTWQVEYDRITPKGALRFPVFVRDRTAHQDKEI